MAFRFYLADLFHQFGHGDGRQLNIEFFQKFPFIAHGGPEIKGSGGYLKYPDVFKGFHHIADCKEIPNPFLKHRILQTAVGQVGKGNLEAAQHLSRSKQTALGIPKPPAVRFRPFIQRSPQKHRHPQLFGKSCAHILRPEITVGKHQSVYAFCLEFFRDLLHIPVIIKKSLRIDILNINKIDSQFLKALRRQIPVL